MEDIAAKAEKVIQSLIQRNNQGRETIYLKTNQIRKFLTAVTSLTNKVIVHRAKTGNMDELGEDLAAEVKYLKVKIAYQAGRERSVKEFVEKSGLINYIDKIGTSSKNYEEFARYVEALVAYHKFYGGRDK